MKIDQAALRGFKTWPVTCRFALGYQESNNFGSQNQSGQFFVSPRRPNTTATTWSQNPAFFASTSVPRSTMSATGDTGTKSAGQSSMGIGVKAGIGTSSAVALVAVTSGLAHCIARRRRKRLFAKATLRRLDSVNGLYRNDGLDRSRSFYEKPELDSDGLRIEVDTQNAAQELSGTPRNVQELEDPQTFQDVEGHIL